MPRLFTGLEIPEDVADELSSLDQPLPGAWWIEDDYFHLTLRFVGDIDNRTADEFADQLGLISMDAFEIQLTGLGTFGGNDPRSLWTGVAPSEPLDALQRAHERAARNAGLPPERRSFKPHVTLARLSHTRIEALARYLARRGGWRSRPFQVERFVLYSSRPQTGGGPYVVEEAYPLRGGWVGDARREKW
ncbi:MAG: RNA 2',3'-cyclic phosphodiesterase [Hyphomicrobium sp.]|nr:RNA 2',3'-cyclic phosphodiesterase [Hyphomicrobium sp.]